MLFEEGDRITLAKNDKSPSLKHFEKLEEIKPPKDEGPKKEAETEE
jgi:hypothetical protein